MKKVTNYQKYLRIKEILSFPQKHNRSLPLNWVLSKKIIREIDSVYKTVFYTKTELVGFAKMWTPEMAGLNDNVLIHMTGEEIVKEYERYLRKNGIRTDNLKQKMRRMAEKTPKHTMRNSKSKRSVYEDIKKNKELPLTRNGVFITYKTFLNRLRNFRSNSVYSQNRHKECMRIWEKYNERM